MKVGASPQFGTGFPDCGTFTAQGGAIYSGSLYDFQQNKNSYANGVAANPGAATKWVTSDTLVAPGSFPVSYRLDVCLDGDDIAPAVTVHSPPPAPPPTRCPRRPRPRRCASMLPMTLAARLAALAALGVLAAAPFLPSTDSPWHVRTVR